MSETPRPNFKQTAQKWYEALNGPLGFSVTLIGIAALYFGAVDWRVRSIVKDPDFVDEAARRVRPAMVFDAEGRVLPTWVPLHFSKKCQRWQ